MGRVRGPCKGTLRAVVHSGLATKKGGRRRESGKKGIGEWVREQWVGGGLTE